MTRESESLFDARGSRCDKCGSDDVTLNWHGPGPDHETRRYARCRSYGEDWGKPRAEHLHYHCRTCQNHEGPCCPACMKIAAALEATGESDPMYSGSIRCCCHAEMKEAKGER